MNKNIPIAIAVTIPFMGYILFSDPFNSGPTIQAPTQTENETSGELQIDTEQVLFVPAGYRRLPEDYTIVIDVAILPGTINELWVIYGTDANNLKLETPPVSDELGMGMAGEYGYYSLAIPHSELQAGTSYFYRIAVETTEGEVLYSGINQFTAGK